MLSVPVYVKGFCTSALISHFLNALLQCLASLNGCGQITVVPLQSLLQWCAVQITHIMLTHPDLLRAVGGIHSCYCWVCVCVCVPLPFCSVCLCVRLCLTALRWGVMYECTYQ